MLVVDLFFSFCGKGFWEPSSGAEQFGNRVTRKQKRTELAKAIGPVIVLTVTEINLLPLTGRLGDNLSDELKVVKAKYMTLAADRFDKVCIAVIAADELVVVAFRGAHRLSEVALVQLDVQNGPEPAALEFCLVSLGVFVQGFQQTYPFLALAGVHGDVITYTEAHAEIVDGHVDVDLVLCTIARWWDELWLVCDNFWAGSVYFRGGTSSIDHFVVGFCLSSLA